MHLEETGAVVPLSGDEASNPNGRKGRCEHFARNGGNRADGAKPDPERLGTQFGEREPARTCTPIFSTSLNQGHPKP